MPVKVQIANNIESLSAFFGKRSFIVHTETIASSQNISVTLTSCDTFNVTRGYLWEMTVLFSYSNIGQVNVDRFFRFLATKVKNAQIL